MPVTPRKKTVALTGACGAEEAETLQAWLVAHPAGAIDIAKCDALHTAVLQVVMAAGRPVRGTPADAGLAALLSAALGDGTASA